MELIRHSEDNEWVIKMDAAETAQLLMNASPYGQAYTVGAGREAILTLRIEETDIDTP